MTAGTDVTNVLLGIAVLVGVGVVSFPLTVRLLQPRRRPAQRGRTA